MGFVLGFLLSVAAGFLVTAVVYYAGDQNAGKAIVWGLAVSVVLAVVAGVLYYRKRAAPQVNKPPLFAPEDSPNWKLEENEFDVDRPIAGGRNNEGWIWRRNKFRRRRPQ